MIVEVFLHVFDVTIGFVAGALYVAWKYGVTLDAPANRNDRNRKL